MSPAERLRILGAETVTEIRRMVAALPPPPPEVLDELRDLFAPAHSRAQERARTRQRTDTAA